MQPLEHLIAIARRGRHAGASSGEQRAYRLVNAICNDVPGLDERAVADLCELIKLTLSHPTQVRELLADIIDQ